MKENLIDKIINNMIKNFQYGVIELDSNIGLCSNWVLHKVHKQEHIYIVFSDLDTVANIEQNANVMEIIRKSDHRLLRILMVDSEKDNNEDILQDGITTLVVDYKNKVQPSYFGEFHEALNSISRCIPRVDQGKEKKDMPYVTYTLIAINIVMYLITAILSGNFIDSDINVLVALGAKVNPLIASGQYYRLFTCMFLHGGLLHVALNMYALYCIGPLIEQVYGRYKYIFIYILAGIGSSLLSYKFSDSVSIGASGAIFGLMGAALIFGYKMRERIGKNFVREVITVLIVNLIMSISIPNIDLYGHLGGLIVGSIITIFLKNNMEDKMT